MSEGKRINNYEEIPRMKGLIIAAAAALGLAGCVAVPAPYGPDAYYYPAPAVGFGIYAAPDYRHHRHHHHRHHRHWHRR